MGRLLQLTVLFAVTLFGYSAVADNEFELWKAQFRQTALSKGIQPATLDIALNGLLTDRKVLKLDAYQPEFTSTVWSYLANNVSAERIKNGRQRLAEHAVLLESIASHYGVDKAYLLAIWGMESKYGLRRGNYSVVRSLATLAYAGREERRDFWTQQLLAALQILQRGDMSMVELRGSWAGAIGHTQFIPTTFEMYAVDFDGDGRRDLRHSIADALASAANYLVKSGWQTGQEWGEEVILPAGFDWTLADPDVTKNTRKWAELYQVQKQKGGLLSEGHSISASILLPAGYRGPAFLAYPNFAVIRKYNNSLSYALAIGHLADRLRGKPPIVADWPEKASALSRNEKKELQLLLSAVGYNTEGIDGRIGPNTRSALRRWQTAVGVPTDGYATKDYLEMLRGQAEVQSAD